MRITGVEVSASDEEIKEWFINRGFKVYEKTYSKYENIYHNQTKEIKVTKTVVEHPHSKEPVEINQLFQDIMQRHISSQLLINKVSNFIILGEFDKNIKKF